MESVRVKPAKSWSREEESRLRNLYPTTSVRDLAAIFRRSPEALKSRATLLRIPKAKVRKLWRASDDWMMRAFYPHISNHELARRLRCSVFSMYRRAHLLGLHKSQLYLDSPDACRLRRGDEIGKAFRFPKGHIPANAGLRRPGYCRGRMAETQFRKGSRSSNYLPIGTLRFDSDGYPRRKIADGLGGFGNPKVWEFVHRRVWEAAHGPIPKGHRVWWKDGDKSNNTLTNLELLSGAEHMARTTIHNFPSPLKEVILLKGALKRRIRRMEEANEEHDERSPESPVCDARSLAG